MAIFDGNIIRGLRKWTRETVDQDLSNFSDGDLTDYFDGIQIGIFRAFLEFKYFFSLIIKAVNRWKMSGLKWKLHAFEMKRDIFLWK